MRIELFDDGYVLIYEPYKGIKDSFYLDKKDMKLNLYDDGSYIVDWGWKAASFPPPCDPLKQYRGRTFEAGSQPDFLWETDKGILIDPRDMATPHLINAINMIWRNVFELKNADRPEIMNDWSSVYVDRAAKELTKELQRRVEEA